ncbi:MAG: hypothetical protein K2P81_11555 [Bacteriovoracaceae bacterium]|nr:hypothetical protein [Bacteriovoracaceae bacterium]
MRTKDLFAIILLMVSTTTFGSNLTKWPKHSDPALVSKNFIKIYEQLPLTGSHDLAGTGWSDDFWPKQKGLINRRWNSAGEPGFDLLSPSRDSIKKMSAEEIGKLAPTEKYDLWLGNYDYPLVKRVNSLADKKSNDWSGICDGWSPASLYYPEPRPVIATNPDGIKIPFGASDIKALISFYYAYEVKTPTSQVGLRCYLTRGFTGLSRGCGDDVNPGAFHIIIANKLGIEKHGFIADVDRLKEVWNQPVVGFNSLVKMTKLPNHRAAKDAVVEILVETELIYVDESAPQWSTILGTSKQQYSSLKLEYTLELNVLGEIIGGEWISWIRPDFLWFRQKAEFTGNFKPLEDLYHLSQNKLDMEK